MHLYVLDPPDSSRKVGSHKPAIRSFVRESANGGKAQVDSGGGILGLFNSRFIRVLLKARRGSEQYLSMNSRIAWSYERWELREIRLLRTADFNCSRSSSFRTAWD
jgi:hypothetical protein